MSHPQGCTVVSIGIEFSIMQLGHGLDPLFIKRRITPELIECDTSEDDFSYLVRFIASVRNYLRATTIEQTTHLETSGPIVPDDSI